ncbi:MAG: hypothetical protein RL148_2394 [Planctomycetota bacterium]
MLVLVACAVLPWNLEVFSSGATFAEAVERMGRHLGSFTSPDLGAPMLARCARLAVETLAVALLGTGLGLLLAYPLAMGACRSLVVGEDPSRGLHRVALTAVAEGFRLLLDVLRGVPDFAWALLVANVLGPNAVTGVVAVGISISGIFGKVLSEQWDNVDPARWSALRSTGASRLEIFLYGIQPLSARQMLSFVLMRTECAVRNASVIGVVGGGGLGAGLWDEYTDGSWDRVATVLLTMLAVTAAADIAANLLRNQLRVDPNHPRRARNESVRTTTLRRTLGLGVATTLLAGSIWALWEPLEIVWGELATTEWSFAARYAKAMFTPDLGLDLLASAATASVVPLAIGLVATVAATLLAACLALPASRAFQLDAHRFTGERAGPCTRLARWSMVVTARGLALVMRGVPEVAWVVVLSVFFRQGVTPCVLAVALHSAGVLQRVFTETVDNLSYRGLERIGGACRPGIYLYGALPAALPDWRTYAFFQFEVNVRMGVVLGWVGAGGLGDKFDSNLKWVQLPQAATYLWAMVALTVVIDRTARRLQLQRRRC